MGCFGVVVPVPMPARGWYVVRIIPVGRGERGVVHTRKRNTLHHFEIWSLLSSHNRGPLRHVSERPLHRGVLIAVDLDVRIRLVQFHFEVAPLRYLVLLQLFNQLFLFWAFFFLVFGLSVFLYCFLASFIAWEYVMPFAFPAA